MINFDCSTAADLYSLNDEIAAEREALSGAASDSLGSYEAPAEYAAGEDGRRGRRLGSTGNRRG